MKFRHPTVTDGAISHRDGCWPIVDGVIDCPHEVGRAAGLLPHVEPVESMSVLDGTVEDVRAYLETVTTEEELAELEVLEKAQKNRKGVVDAISARLDELTTPET